MKVGKGTFPVDVSYLEMFCGVDELENSGTEIGQVHPGVMTVMGGCLTILTEEELREVDPDAVGSAGHLIFIGRPEEISPCQHMSKKEVIDYFDSKWKNGESRDMILDLECNEQLLVNDKDEDIVKWDSIYLFQIVDGPILDIMDEVFENEVK